jgi:transcriptional regulator with XRE-family HTH domain
MAKDSSYAENGQQFLRIWRKSKNLTLEQLAERLQNAISTVSGWETGRRTMDMEDLRKLALTYGVHPAALLMDPDEANGQISRMQRAAGLASAMNETQADRWLAVGESMTDKS